VSDEQAAAHGKSVGEHLIELRDMVVAYARQETTDPLLALRRYVAWGAAGSLFVGTGCALLLLGLLRGLQTIRFFNRPAIPNGGHWSWLPYVITLAVAVIMIALSVWRAKKAYDRSVARQRQHDFS
jgi:heme exporter protein D